MSSFELKKRTSGIGIFESFMDIKEEFQLKTGNLISFTMIDAPAMLGKTTMIY